MDIEPDWVHTPDRLIGVYGASVDGLMRLRSISGVKTQVGTNTSQTSVDWTYDENGRVTNSQAPNSLKYTMKDFQNLAQLRRNGYQLIDYEMSKDVANLIMALIGTRDVQAYCGYGCSSGYTTGANSLNTYGNQTRKYSGSNIGNLMFGLQNFVACNLEWADHVAINVVSYKSFLKNKGNSIAADVIDRVWHIYDPVTDTERSVQACAASTTHYTIGRVRFGRYCDCIASRITNDSSAYNQWYSDSYYYSGEKARVVGRGGNNASAGCGLVYAYAGNASSHSNTGNGSRLAFIGKIEIE